MAAIGCERECCDHSAGAATTQPRPAAPAAARRACPPPPPPPPRPTPSLRAPRFASALFSNSPALFFGGIGGHCGGPDRTPDRPIPVQGALHTSTDNAATGMRTAAILALLALLAAQPGLAFKEADFKVRCCITQQPAAGASCWLRAGRPLRAGRSATTAAVAAPMQACAAHCASGSARSQKCDTASFCQRNRGVTGTKYVVEAGSIQVEGSVMTAKLANTAAEAQFDLTLTAYGGIIRLHVDEPGGLLAPACRARPPGRAGHSPALEPWWPAAQVSQRACALGACCARTPLPGARPPPPTPSMHRRAHARRMQVQAATRCPTSWRRAWRSCRRPGRAPPQRAGPGPPPAASLRWGGAAGGSCPATGNSAARHGHDGLVFGGQAAVISVQALAVPSHSTAACSPATRQPPLVSFPLDQTAEDCHPSTHQRLSSQHQPSPHRGCPHSAGQADAVAIQAGAVGGRRACGGCELEGHVPHRADAHQAGGGCEGRLGL